MSPEIRTMRRPSRPLVSICAALVTTCLISPAALAQKSDHDHDHDQDESLEMGKHVHGAVTFNVVLENDLLSVEIDAPAINVLGFEKSPRNDAERQRLAETNAWLASGRQIAGVPRSAGCRLDTTVFDAPKLGSGHADFRPRYVFRCSNPSALEWVELWALRRLKGVEKTEVNVISTQVQKQETLAPGALRVSLK
jgi:hypothetical protein